MFEKYKSQNFRCVIFSNQSSFNENFRKKLIEITEILGCDAMVSKKHDLCRKPCFGMWDYYLGHSNIRKQNIHPDSFYCGDACGRDGDFADSDLKFAINIGINFYQPEELFENREKMVCNLKNTIPQLSGASIYDSINPSSAPEIIILIGPPGCGKSTFSNQEKFGHYMKINQDTLKTLEKCVKTAKHAMQNNQSIIIDNTNPSEKTRQKYLEIMPENYIIRYIHFNIPAEWAYHNSYYRHALNPSNKLIPKIAFLKYKKDLEIPQDSHVVTINQLQLQYVTNMDLYNKYYL